MRFHWLLPSICICANAVAGRSHVNGLETYYFDSGLPLAQTTHTTILQNVNV